MSVLRDTADNPWLVRPRPNPAARRRLFCFPYAGGGSHVFNDWPEGLPPDLEVCPVQLPGRGRRLREPPHTRMRELVEALFVGLRPFLDKPFMFFGHSMGAMLCFELARRLRREGLALPSHLFVSGRRAVQVRVEDARTYDLPEPEFVGELSRLNGTPRDLLAHAEMLSLILPTLRADFEVVQTYEYTPGPPFRFPVTALGGLEDYDVPWEQLDAWREQTTGQFRLHMLPGDHFFVHASREYVLKIIAREARESGAPRPGRAPGDRAPGEAR